MLNKKLIPIAFEQNGEKTKTTFLLMCLNQSLHQGTYIFANLHIVFISSTPTTAHIHSGQPCSLFYWCRSRVIAQMLKNQQSLASETRTVKIYEVHFFCLSKEQLSVLTLIVLPHAFKRFGSKTSSRKPNRSYS